MTPHQQTVAFHTLGCKLNFSETSTIARTMRHKGFEVVDFNESADIYIINTCSVTDHADRKCKKFVKESLRRNPEAKIAVIGCYAQLKPREISEIPGVDMVLGAREKFNLPDHIAELGKTDEQIILNGHIKEVDGFHNAYSAGDRTRSFLKVQDGCNYFCSFCTIPLARGKSRSDYIANIERSAREIADRGVKEIVLTGVNIGDFRNDRGENFLDLIKSLDQVEGIRRFRISSIEPNLLSNEIIDFVASSEKFVPHYHIPLQSGSNEILREMRRRYVRELYRERVEKIRELMPESCIGVDVIVGFPGETEEKFLETYRFLNELDVSYLHVFTYSERPNTTAVRLKDVVPNKVRTTRRRMLQGLSHKKRMMFYRRHLGTTREVLFEDADRNGDMFGFTDNYIKVRIDHEHHLGNVVVHVDLKDINEGGTVEGSLCRIHA